MARQVGRVGKSHLAEGAAERLLVRVNAHVRLQVTVARKCLAAIAAVERSYLAVNTLEVLQQVVTSGVGLAADVALVVQLLGVHAPDVAREAVAPREALAAVAALVRFHLRMRHRVALEVSLVIRGVITRGATPFFLR